MTLVGVVDNRALIVAEDILRRNCVDLSSSSEWNDKNLEECPGDRYSRRQAAQARRCLLYCDVATIQALISYGKLRVHQ